MGMQLRKRDGDRRWYSADRDLVHGLPRILRRTLETMSEFRGEDPAARESLLQTSARLGGLVADIVRSRLSKEALADKLRELPVRDRELIGGALLFVLLSEFRAWVVDARPKAPGDVELEDCDLGGLAEYFARLSLGDQA